MAGTSRGRGGWCWSPTRSPPRSRSLPWAGTASRHRPAHAPARTRRRPQAPPLTPPSDDNGTGGADHCGLLDLSCKVRHAINSWFQDLVDRITRPVMELVGSTVLSTPDISHQQRAKDLWTACDKVANLLMGL